MFAFVTQLAVKPNMFFAATSRTNYADLVSLRFKMSNTRLFIGEGLDKIQEIQGIIINVKYTVNIVNFSELSKYLYNYFHVKSTTILTCFL